MNNAAEAVNSTVNGGKKKAAAKGKAKTVTKGKAKTVAKGKAKKAGVPRGPRENTVAFIIREGLKGKLTDAQIVANVRRKQPTSKFATDETIQKKHLAWYKWKVKQQA